MRPTRATIDLANLSFNFHSVRKFIGREMKIMAVVKANAYGHGAAECAKSIESAGADWFGVATIGEALELREAGIIRPILTLGGVWPGEEGLILRENITPAIFDLQTAGLIDKAAADRGVRKKVHIKIDTGMGRVGVPFQDVAGFAERLSAFKSLEVEGAMTHFAAADDLDENEYTEKQVVRFNNAVNILREYGFSPEIIDLSNSPGAVAHPEIVGNMVRLGGVLYGLSGDILPAGIKKPELRPVMSLTSELALVKKVNAGESLGYNRTFVAKRDSVIGTAPIGYNDGLRRGLSNNGNAIVNGVRAPIVGRVSMDWTILDLTEVSDPQKGDDVVFIGSNGEASITAEELAGSLKTLSYEITCGISYRVPRLYRSENC